MFLLQEFESWGCSSWDFNILVWNSWCQWKCAGLDKAWALSPLILFSYILISICMRCSYVSGDEQRGSDGGCQWEGGRGRWESSWKEPFPCYCCSISWGCRSGLWWTSPGCYTERLSPPSQTFNLRESQMQTMRWKSRDLDVLGSFLDAVCNTTNEV